MFSSVQKYDCPEENASAFLQCKKVEVSKNANNVSCSSSAMQVLPLVFYSSTCLLVSHVKDFHCM